MIRTALKSIALLSLMSLASGGMAENHQAEGAFGVKYGSEDCNNTPEFMSQNDITCTAVFSDVRVWDFLEGLPRRIPLDMLIELNPDLEIADFETILTGITFVRVR